MSYFKKEIDLSIEELHRLNHITMVLDFTNIASTDRYRYEMVKNKTQLMYKSKCTILERPSWKSEKVVIKLMNKRD